MPARSKLRRFARWLERLLAVVGLLFIVYHLGFEFAVMTSDSMAPALQGTSYENGDRIVVEKISSDLRTPKRWEIYFYYDNDGLAIAKRIVGLPGENISLRDNKIYVNGIEVPRPTELRDLKYYNQGMLARGREVKCGDAYFMLGDSSADSYDSRFTGPVSKERFQGRALCVFWPFGRIGFVR